MHGHHQMQATAVVTTSLNVSIQDNAISGKELKAVRSWCGVAARPIPPLTTHENVLILIQECPF